MSTDRNRIRALNDELRQHLLGGGAVMTPGIAALGPEAVGRLVQTISIFDDFCAANDPYTQDAVVLLAITVLASVLAHAGCGLVEGAKLIIMIIASVSNLIEGI